MIRKIQFQRLTASICGLGLLAATFALFPTTAFSQGKTTTESYTDASRGVNVERTRDEKGNVTNEKESDLQGNLLKETDNEYNKDGSLKKSTTRRYRNGKKRSETVIIYDPDGSSHGTMQSWDEDGKPNGSGKGRIGAVHANIAPPNSGLRSVTFSSPNGAIRVNLPDDMAAGDTISGTVMMDPAGRTEAERAANTAVLSGYVLETGQGRRLGTILDRTFKFVLPIEMMGMSLWLTRDGTPVQRIDVPVAPTPTPFDGNFSLPEIAQAGRPVEILGRFDGDASNTSAKFEGRNVEILAESPRSMVLASPTDVTGPAQLTIQEGSSSAEATVHNVRLSLSASKTNLMKGETAVLTAKVEGLQGLTPDMYPLLIDVMNQSPSVIRMHGATSIAYESVDTTGCATLSLPVQGIRSGSYAITASLR